MKRQLTTILSAVASFIISAGSAKLHVGLTLITSADALKKRALSNDFKYAPDGYIYDIKLTQCLCKTD